MRNGKGTNRTVNILYIHGRQGVVVDGVSWPDQRIRFTPIQLQSKCTCMIELFEKNSWFVVVLALRDIDIGDETRMTMVFVMKIPRIQILPFICAWEVSFRRYCTVPVSRVAYVLVYISFYLTHLTYYLTTQRIGILPASHQNLVHHHPLQ